MPGTNEAFSRVKIDAQLKDQSWEIDNPNAVRYEVMLGDGTRADYVLCDRHGRSLAVIEAKKAATNPAEAEAQAIGKTAIFRGADRPCIAGAYLIEIGFNAQVNPEYVLHFLFGAVGQSQLTRGSRAVAQPKNAPTICAIPIPLPPLEKQARFAASVDQWRATQTIQASATAKAEAAFNAILGRVFSGDGRKAPVQRDAAEIAA